MSYKERLSLLNLPHNIHDTCLNLGEEADKEIKKLQATPCEWCDKTSEQIDSLEFELEGLQKLAQQVVDIKNPKDVVKARNKAMVLLLTKGEI